MIVCVVEHEAGALKSDSVEALAFSGRLAADTGGGVHAVAFGPGAEAVAGAAGRAGVSSVHAACTGLDVHASPRAWAHALVDIVAATGPEAVVGPGSDRGNEVMAYAAAMADRPMAANCTQVVAGDPWRVSRLRWAGSLLEDATLDGAAPKLITVAPGAGGEPAGPAVDAQVQVVDTALDERDLRVVVSESVEPAGQGVALTEARVVVGGGRGVGGPDGFGVLEELAGLLGGAVGVSRVVTSEGWRPHRDQVGQTGTRISPDLYIACGISGAIQHMAGCRSARRILAINRDPNAAIMSKADYVVVGDLHAVLPAVVAEVRRRTGN